MKIRQNRSWMYNRLLSGQKGYTDEFLNGVEEFVSFACQQQAYLSNGKIRCPCSKCKNLKYLTPKEVRVHLFRRGFLLDYWHWTCHGENDPDLCVAFNTQSSTSTTQDGNNEHTQRFETVDHDLLHAAQILSQIPSTASPTTTPSPILSPATAASSSRTPHFNLSPSVPSVDSSTPQINGAFASGSQDPSNTQTCNDKAVLYLDGLGFLPSHLAANGISDIFKSHYTDSWPSWKKIPPRIRETWFEEFKEKFSFCPPNYTWARKNFEMRGAALLKNALGKARNVMNRPSWLGNTVWDRLCEHWASEAFKKKSTQAKTNRASDCGGFGSSLHTCGSITTSQHKANLTKLTGKAPSPLELFRHTHKFKDKSWVDKRAAHVDAKFTRTMEEMIRRASEQGTHPPNELDVWCDTIGIKKGRIYGLGLESTVVAERSYFHGSCSKSNEWVQRTEHEELAKRIQKVQNDKTVLLTKLENNERELKKNNQLIREMRQMMYQLFDLQRSSGLQHLPRARDMIEEEDDDDDSGEEEDDEESK